MSDAAQLRALIIDDSRLDRRGIHEALDLVTGLDLTGATFCAERGLQLLANCRVDVVFIDLAIPGLGSLQFLHAIQSMEGPTPAVFVMGRSAQVGSQDARAALSLGAVAFITKPDTPSAVRGVSEHIQRELQRLPHPAALPPTTPAPPWAPVELVCIVSSTGGPEALAVVLCGLPPTLQVPILITQHLPAQFVAAMCGNLQKKALRPVTMARDGARIEAGHVYMAPGHAHLTVGCRLGGYTCALDYGPARAACIPSGNIMLESAAASTGGRLLGVCLTGMGDDGADGMAAVRVAGGRVIAQDEASSVVWGMPGAVIGRGDADYVLPLSEIASGITQLISPPANDNPNDADPSAHAA